jgi:hypothetical protein
MCATSCRSGRALQGGGGEPLTKYLYDFGDGWKHTIKVERLIDPESGVLYPRLIAAKGHCPPEDVGGPWGYGEFLEAIADPSHERHNELKEWFADDFNPHVVDVDWLSAATGRCPPEDCGGPWGYAEFLDAIRDPAHERHAELKEWIGCDFDPDNVDNEELAGCNRRD